MELAELALGVLDSFKDRFRLQHHARSAPEGPVVGRPVAVSRVVPDVDELDPEPAFLLRDAEDALVQIGFARPWKERQDRAEHQSIGASPQKGQAQ